ncbi:hypothetical protein LSAT2_029258 [Lamellibrachia satsuma]|nr:hypothetical protein LSAT2_029258 [Lamellibrachia satsuma]
MQTSNTSCNEVPKVAAQPQTPTPRSSVRRQRHLRHAEMTRSVVSRVAHLSHEPFYQTGAPKHDIRRPGQIARLIGGERASQFLFLSEPERSFFPIVSCAVIAQGSSLILPDRFLRSDCPGFVTSPGDAMTSSGKRGQRPDNRRQLISQLLRRAISACCRFAVIRDNGVAFCTRLWLRRYS